MTLVYLKFFNNQFTLPGALALSASQIIILFQSFATNESNKYGVHEGAQNDIHTAISMIGTIRTRNSKENPGFIETNPHFIEVGYQGNRFKLKTLYDIVGWIFSVVGNVPDLATRENYYYYPLMMIAYVFSKKLVPDVTFQPRNGNPIVKSAPDVWMVMWFNQMVDNQLVTRVVLGATLDMPTAQVKGGTKYFRKNLLREAGIIKEGVLAPLQQHGRQDFGHCAESYPLLFIWSIARDLPEICGSAEGISAKTINLYDASTSRIMPYMVNGVVNGGIIPPCENCAFLMEENGFTVARFKEGLGK